MTLIVRPVSSANFSRIWRVGFGVAIKATLSISSCLGLIVVRGPLLLQLLDGRTVSPPVSEVVILSLPFKLFKIVSGFSEGSSIDFKGK